MHAGDGLQLELRHMHIDYHEALLCEHRAVGQAQSLDIALCTSGPRAQVPNSAGQSVESLRAFPTKEMQALVLVGSIDLVAHSELRSRTVGNVGNSANIGADANQTA
jgi:hypothetical protein